MAKLILLAAITWGNKTWKIYVCSCSSRRFNLIYYHDISSTGDPLTCTRSENETQVIEALTSYKSFTDLNIFTWYRNILTATQICITFTEYSWGETWLRSKWMRLVCGGGVLRMLASPQSITAGLVALTWLSVSHIQICSDSVSASP